MLHGRCAARRADRARGSGLAAGQSPGRAGDRRASPAHPRDRGLRVLAVGLRYPCRATAGTKCAEGRRDSLIDLRGAGLIRTLPSRCEQCVGPDRADAEIVSRPGLPRRIWSMGFAACSPNSAPGHLPDSLGRPEAMAAGTRSADRRAWAAGPAGSQPGRAAWFNGAGECERGAALRTRG